MTRLASGYRRQLLAFGLVASMFVGASPAAAACDTGPSSAPTNDSYDLDDDATSWGVYCNGDTSPPDTALGNTADSSTGELLLEFAYAGGDPGDFAHLYRNLIGDATADEFILSLDFLYAPENGAASADAVSFGFSSWISETRYEWAVQWQSLDDGHTWKFWNGHDWIDLGVSRDLTPGAWHHFELRGSITRSGEVNYRSFKIDGHTSQIRLTVAPVAGYTGWSDMLAVATTMVGDIAEDSPGTRMNLLLDNVHLIRRSKNNPSVDDPGPNAPQDQSDPPPATDPPPPATGPEGTEHADENTIPEVLELPDETSDDSESQEDPDSDDDDAGRRDDRRDRVTRLPSVDWRLADVQSPPAEIGRPPSAERSGPADAVSGGDEDRLRRDRRSGDRRSWFDRRGWFDNRSRNVAFWYLR